VSLYSRFRRWRLVGLAVVGFIGVWGCSSTEPTPRVAEPHTSAPSHRSFSAWEASARSRSEDLLDAARRAAAAGEAARAQACSDQALAVVFQPPAGYPVNPRYMTYAAQVLEESASLDDQLDDQLEGQPEDATADDSGDMAKIIQEDLPDLTSTELPPGLANMLPSSDLPLVLNGAVQRYLDMFTDPNEYRARIAKGLLRGAAYLPMIRTRLKAAGLPQDLAYLPLIESAFSPVARSRARATGMWQFISSTARLYGLRVSPLIDERRDPERSTDAAIAFLSDLHAQFGNWYLALAAYNSGVGNVRRAIRRAHSSNFWKIRRYLPRETRNYVPAFIASVIVAKEPGRFGLDPPGPSAWTFDTINVPDAVDLQFLSSRLDIPLDELRKLNPAVRRDLTPAGQVTQLRLPRGMRARAEALLRSVPRKRWAPRLIHTVVRGESLYTIARRYGSTVASIRQANGLRRNLIHPGQSLVVPRLGLVARRTAPRSRRAVRIRAGEKIYVVRANDTLWDISRAFHVSVRRLRAANRLSRRSLLHPRQRLVIPRASHPHRKPRAIVSRSASRANLYTVHRGDTLFEIARRFGTTVRALRHANRLRSSRIHPGDVLQIPDVEASS